MSKEETKKAEYPMNKLGLGFRSTLESGPYFKDDVDYLEPFKNERYTHCGACAFWRDGKCLALEEEVHILAACKLYISMAHELELRHQSLMLRFYAVRDGDTNPTPEQPTISRAITKDGEEEVAYEEMSISLEELTIFEVTQKRIVKEKGKYCVRSHQTGKSFGCYGTRAAAVKRLGQIKGFKGDDIPEDTEILEPIMTDGTTNMDFEVKFASMDEERRLVYGIVMEPDEVDAHGDTVTSAEIEKAAHGYMMKPMIVGDGHVKRAKAQPVQSFIYDEAVLKEVKPGSWVMAIKVHSDKIWEGVKSGDYTGFSIGAMVRKVPLEIEKEEVEENV